MGVPLNSERLKLELARRGWSQADLASAAGLSRPTVTAAMSGKPVAPRSLRRIAIALAQQHTIDTLIPLVG
ncbi:MAG TPA: helix-turn-helix transcriptional regulator [Chloroflexota bacterium]|nr:helix-turn-helix transcriptional regulator [Chloroflexota bacterium]